MKGGRTGKILLLSECVREEKCDTVTLLSLSPPTQPHWSEYYLGRFSYFTKKTKQTIYFFYVNNNK